jgi:hypothetical protein
MVGSSIQHALWLMVSAANKAFMTPDYETSQGTFTVIIPGRDALLGLLAFDIGYVKIHRQTVRT